MIVVALKTVIQFEPKILPPTENQIALAKKFDREPKSLPEIPKEQIVSHLNIMKDALDKGKMLHKHSVDELKHYYDSNDRFRELFPGTKEVLELLYEYSKRLMSRTEHGYTVNRNRRQSLYKKFVDRFFSDWDVDVSHNFFTMQRKR